MARIDHTLILAALITLIWVAAANAQSLMERLMLPGDLTQPHTHLQNDCSNCHEDFRKGAQVQLCLDCHKVVMADISESLGFHGRSPEAQAFECNHCHTDHEGSDFDIASVDQDTFDHSLTDFPLVGAHRLAVCGACHAEDTTFREAKSACRDCHLEDDRHKGALGRGCSSCHISTNWAEVTAFDHSKSDFPLTNAHENVACGLCHAGEIYEDLPQDCVGCHRIQDVHDDRFGPKCDTCHKNTKWTEIRFDHNADTDFRLEGAHHEVGCNACHTQKNPDHPMRTDCVGCHAPDDPHRGALGPRCEACHTTSSWITEVRFDHHFTDFPLIGQHGVLPCEACHSDSSFQITDSRCVTCHASDDHHQSRLGPACETCHNPNGWAYWLFDHDRQTRFALTGAHASVKCESCHTSPVTARPDLPRSCISCHRREDVHRRSFGTNCSACHSTATFKGARLK